MTTYPPAVGACDQDVRGAAPGSAASSCVVLAVKDLSRAKSRLAGELGSGDRERLVLAMFTDTLAAVRGARSTDRILVVTPDSRVAGVAVRAGAEVITEVPDPTPMPADASLNAAYRRGAAALVPPPPMVIALQADLPALTPEELDGALFDAPCGRSVVTDHTGHGTTALITRGRGTGLDPRFGPDSARAHLASGASALDGARWPGLRTDVDTLEDLRVVIDIGVGQHTRREIDRLRRRGVPLPKHRS